MKKYGHWDISKVGEFDPKEWYGFIYLIVNKLTGKAYIGKKIFKHTFRIKVKGRKNRKKVIKDSNWKEYTGSCKPLNEDIEVHGKNSFTFEIIKLCSGKSELTYEEQEVQFLCDVLRAKTKSGEKKFYNNTIGSKNYRGLVEQSLLTESKLKDEN